MALYSAEAATSRLIVNTQLQIALVADFVLLRFDRLN